MTLRVLYIETAPQAGGSTISLFELVRHLDRELLQPAVLLCATNPYAARFSSLGVPVIRTALHCSLRAPYYPAPLARARSSTLAARMRAMPLTRVLWRAGGLAVRTATHTWPQARDIARTIRQSKTDLVHLNDAPALHKAGILGSRLAGVPCVCHVRSMPPLDALDRTLARFVGHFIFISRAVETDQRRRGLGTRPGTVIYNALDLSAYKQLPARETARQRFGLDPCASVVGMLGRIEPWKGHRDLLAALALLAPGHANLRCLIAGKADQDSAWYQDELRAQVRDLHLEGVVQFVGYQEDVRHFLAALDVLVHASVEPEPFGRVLIEGMAAGLPIVATNAGGVPEIVTDEGTGLLVPPGQPSVLAGAIGRLIADPTAGQAMGASGHQRARELFAIDRHVAAVLQIYKTVVGDTLGTQPDATLHTKG